MIATVAIDVASLLFGLPLRQMASAVRLLSGLISSQRLVLSPG